VVVAVVAAAIFIVATRWQQPWLAPVVVIGVVILVKAAQLLGIRVARRGSRNDPP
jgi:hypothetical protein